MGKEYIVIVESMYTEQYYLQDIEDDQEITTELLGRKGEFEETLEFQWYGKIIEIEEVK